MKAWQVLLALIAAIALYRSATADRRRARQRTLQAERRVVAAETAVGSADKAFDEELAHLPPPDSDDYVVALVTAHLAAIRRGIKAAGWTPEVVDRSWLLERVEQHAALVKWSAEQLGRLASEAALAFLDKANGDLNNASDRARHEGRSFHEFHVAISGFIETQKRAEQLAKLYVTTLGDDRQRALLAQLSR